MLFHTLNFCTFILVLVEVCVCACVCMWAQCPLLLLLLLIGWRGKTWKTLVAHYEYCTCADYGKWLKTSAQLSSPCCVYISAHRSQPKEPITNSFVAAYGFSELALRSPWRWYTCAETLWRSSFCVCTNYECAFIWCNKWCTPVPYIFLQRLQNDCDVRHFERMLSAGREG